MVTLHSFGIILSFGSMMILHVDYCHVQNASMVYCLGLGVLLVFFFFLSLFFYLFFVVIFTQTSIKPHFAKNTVLNKMLNQPFKGLEFCVR